MLIVFLQAFFYRNFKRLEVLVCESQNECEPEAGSGFKCPACRMKKCLQLGMSLEGKLTGPVFSTEWMISNSGTLHKVHKTIRILFMQESKREDTVTKEGLT